MIDLDPRGVLHPRLMFILSRAYALPMAPSASEATAILPAQLRESAEKAFSLSMLSRETPMTGAPAASKSHFLFSANVCAFDVAAAGERGRIEL